MRQIIFLIVAVLSVQTGSYGQNTVIPFRNLFKYIDTLIFRGSPTNNRGFKDDTLFATSVKKLEQQRFSNQNAQIEKYGVTPDGSISLYWNGKKIALISCWNINKSEYGLNIRINEKLTYHGLTISKSVFDELFMKYINK